MSKEPIPDDSIREDVRGRWTAWGNSMNQPTREALKHLNSVSERKVLADKIVGDFATNGMDAYTEIYRLYIDEK